MLTAAGSPEPEVIGAGHLEVVRSALDRSGKHDAVQGSAKLCPAVAVLRDQVETWLGGRYSVDRGVNDELQGATPRVSALAHLRAAQAHAHLGESGAFGREIAKAMQHLDKGPYPDDPPFLHFMTSQELTGLRGASLQALRKPDRAVQEFQAIIDDPDPAYRRNLGIYSIRLARAHVENRDITAAAETGLSAMDLVAELESSRTQQRLTERRQQPEISSSATTTSSTPHE